MRSWQGEVRDSAPENTGQAPAKRETCLMMSRTFSLSKTLSNVYPWTEYATGSNEQFRDAIVSVVCR
jgi:hypothetical protein